MLGVGRLPALGGMHRVAGTHCGAKTTAKTRCAGDTVLIIALSLAARRETLARRSATLGPPAPYGAVWPRVAPPHTRPRSVMAPDGLTSPRAGSAPGQNPRATPCRWRKRYSFGPRFLRALQIETTTISSSDFRASYT